MGIDVSHWNNAVEVQRYLNTSSTDFCFVKATEGITYVDRKFWEYTNMCKQAGKLPGAYHYARPENNNAIDEAKNFMATIDLQPGEKRLLALDWEGNALKCDPEWARDWLDYVYKHTGIRPFLYCSQSVVKKMDVVKNGNYGLWVARYKKDVGDVSPWDTYAIHQYTSSPVDSNSFNGTLAQLYKYAEPKAGSEEHVCEFKSALYAWLTAWEEKNG